VEGGFAELDGGGTFCMGAVPVEAGGVFVGRPPRARPGLGPRSGRSGGAIGRASPRIVEGLPGLGRPAVGPGRKSGGAAEPRGVGRSGRFRRGWRKTDGPAFGWRYVFHCGRPADVLKVRRRDSRGRIRKTAGAGDDHGETGRPWRRWRVADSDVNVRQPTRQRSRRSGLTPCPGRVDRRAMIRGAGRRPGLDHVKRRVSLPGRRPRLPVAYEVSTRSAAGGAFSGGHEADRLAIGPCRSVARRSSCACHFRRSARSTTW